MGKVVHLRPSSGAKMNVFPEQHNIHMVQYAVKTARKLAPLSTQQRFCRATKLAKIGREYHPTGPETNNPPTKSSTAKCPQIPHHRVTCRSRRVDTFFRKMSRLSQIHTQRADPSSSTEIQGVFELQQL